MAYVPVAFPQYVYGSDGMPLMVTNQASAAQLPATFTMVPKTPAAIVAFPPALIAQVVKLPPAVAVALPPVLSKLIALNDPHKSGNGNH